MTFPTEFSSKNLAANRTIAEKRPRSEMSSTESFPSAFSSTHLSKLSSFKNDCEGTGARIRGVKRASLELLIDEVSVISIEKKSPEEQQASFVEKATKHVLAMYEEDLPTMEKNCFMGDKVPSIDFGKYVERLIQNSNVWAGEKHGMESIGVRSALVAIEYLSRASVKISAMTVHRYFLTSFLIGIKLMYDYYMSNSYWANVGGISLQEINEMEIAFCVCLKWNFAVSVDAFKKQMKTLQVE